MTARLEDPHPQNTTAFEKIAHLAIVFAAAVLLLAMFMATLVGMTERRDDAIDDAYITYVYGQNLADGHGIRYNATDDAPTEGSSSLLHLLIVAGGKAFDVDPLTVTRTVSILGFAVFVLTMGFVASRHASAGPPAALTAAAVTAFGLLFIKETVGHMAAGMETTLMFVLHGLFFCWTLLFATAAKRPRLGFLVLGTLLGVALILVRPEGFILAFMMVGAAFVARAAMAGSGSRGQQIIGTARDIAPVVIGLTAFLIAYFLWKISYFGDIFPTAYWVKSKNNIFGSNGELLPGLKHVAGFLVFRWLPLAIVAFGIMWSTGARRTAKTCAFLILPSLAIILLYSRAIHEVTGGFRYGHPLTSPLFVVCAIGLALHIKRFRILLPVALFTGVAAVFLVTHTPDSRAIQLLRKPTFALTGWVKHEPDMVGLSPVARDLRSSGLGQDATILTSAAGVIPYLSGFNAIDWLGLNDEQLSGKYPMTIEEVRDYIASKNPDASMSIFPAAAAGVESYVDDPGFNSNSVQATLNGRGVKLFKHWDRELASKMIWNQMTYLRDSTDLATCYPLFRNWAIFIYVDRSSPHYDRLIETFRESDEADCDPDRIEKMYDMDFQLPN